MHTLPNDAQGRSWVEMQADGDISEEQSALLTLVAADDDFQLEVLGTAFIVSANGSNAICLGAAHSFEPVKRRQAARGGGAFLNVPKDFLPKGPDFFKSDEVHALYVKNGTAHACRIDQVNYIADYDVAVFTVYEVDSMSIFDAKVAIDLGAPSIGETLAVMANEIGLEKRDGGEGVVSQRFSMRMGVVTGVEMGKGAMPGLSVYFQTTIPVYGGMSGAPVIKPPSNKGDPIIVVGLVSTDHSPSEAFKDFRVPGLSAATMIWPAMGLGLNAGFGPDGKAGHVFLNEFVDRKLMDNRSQGVAVAVRGDSEKIEILYEDRRSGTPWRTLLTTTGHPGVGKSV